MANEEHKTVWEGKFLRVKVSGHWEYAERPNSPAGVILVAVTPENEILLTEQFRIPLQKRVLELPAGLAGDGNYSGEPLLEAAKRELREETGYEASSWEELTGGPPSAGLSNEWVVFFRARDLCCVGPGGGEGEHEKIQIHKVPLATVHEWLVEKSRSGIAVDPKVYAGLYFLLASAPNPRP
jgi:ADP-ribose pyrophosphatase